MSIRLYVGNLPKEPIEREALQAVFVDEGDIVSTKVIKDRKTGKCRGFAFVTVSTDEIADAFIAKYDGQSFMESPLKIEKALPRAKGKSDEDGAEESEETVTEKPVAKVTKRTTTQANKKGRGGRTQSTTTSSTTEGIQPDPRWADELAKLKEMLAASSN
jgi:RNA recognition motif-containing protein